MSATTTDTSARPRATYTPAIGPKLKKLFYLVCAMLAVIGANSLLGAGGLVTERKIFEAMKLIVGAPARVIREVSPEMLGIMQRDNADYVRRARQFRETLVRIG